MYTRLIKMGKKIYFVIILLLSLFTYYYQFSIYSNFSFMPILLFVRDAALIIGGFSAYFKKDIFEPKIWNLVFKLLIVVTIGTFIYQILPTSYYGDFSLVNGSFLTNVFVYLFFLCFYLPLYFAVYQLSKKTKKK